MATMIKEAIGRELLAVWRRRWQRSVVSMRLANRGRHEGHALRKGFVVDTVGKEMIGDIPNRFRNNRRTVAIDDLLIVG